MKLLQMKNSSECNSLRRPQRYVALKFQLKDFSRMLEIPSFNKTFPTVIYIHGYLASGRNDPSAVAIRSAYLDRGDHNVITFSWLFYSINYYHFVVPQLKVVSDYRILIMK